MPVIKFEGIKKNIGAGTTSIVLEEEEPATRHFNIPSTFMENPENLPFGSLVVDWRIIGLSVKKNLANKKKFWLVPRSVPEVEGLSLSSYQNQYWRVGAG